MTRKATDLQTPNELLAKLRAAGVEPFTDRDLAVVAGRVPEQLAPFEWSARMAADLIEARAKLEALARPAPDAERVQLALRILAAVETAEALGFEAGLGSDGHVTIRDLGAVLFSGDLGAAERWLGDEEAAEKACQPAAGRRVVMAGGVKS